MKTFYIPIHLIRYFISKENGNYRHVLAFRVYLYLIFFHHGRIRFNNRKELVKIFNSSHTAILKSLIFLESCGFVKVRKGWIESISWRKLDIEVQDKIRFEFTEPLLYNRNQFVNHLYVCAFQTSAMKRGKKRQTKVNKYQLDPQYLEWVSQRIPHLKVPQEGTIINEFIQKQSLTYLGNMIDRHPITVFKRNRKINNENHYLLNPFPKRTFTTGNRAALTEGGFIPKTYSKICTFPTLESAKQHRNLKLGVEYDHFKGSFIGKSKYGNYLIIKGFPTEYTYSIPFKLI